MSGRALHPGAQPGDWAHFEMILGLGADLLPVVSNLAAKIAPGSSVKSLGKIPTRYNANGQVSGVKDWPRNSATAEDISAWAKQPDYGICIQTRHVRALDIDVPDKTKAESIVRYVTQQLGVCLPKRYRADSGKVLLALVLPGDFAKREMRVDGGIVEFLATGQQFIAAGTNPSGARYEWEGGLPHVIPELDAPTFETLWASLVDVFAVAPPTAVGAGARKKGERLLREDKVAELLSLRGDVLGEDRDGALVIPCPWADEHTSGETGDGSTVWFPAGTNGYEQGHFKCLHGHCTGRTDAAFFEAIGYVEDVAAEFDVIAPPVNKARPLPLFRRDKSGNIEGTIDNVAMAVRRPDVCGMDIRFDRFRDEIVFAPAEGGGWRTFTDQDYTRLRITLERGGFKPIGRELIRDVVLLVGSENGFDLAIEWLEGLQWDGVPRVAASLTKYFNVEQTAYSEAVAKYLWTALAGRVMSPGCKADMVPILVGAQDAGKSTAVAAIAPSLEFFVEVSFGEQDSDLSRKMRGRLVAEIGELRGLHTREQEAIKAFITRTHENWIPKYREFAVQFPRRLVFIGTTNKDEFLADETGNRRWLPVRVGAVDVAGLARDRLQLWAEGRELFAEGGVAYKGMGALAAEAHAEHTMSDSWVETVRRWLREADTLTGESPGSRKFLQTGEVLHAALGLDPRHVGRREELRISEVLRGLGYARKKVRAQGVAVWGFVPDVPLRS